MKDAIDSGRHRLVLATAAQAGGAFASVPAGAADMVPATPAWGAMHGRWRDARPDLTVRIVDMLRGMPADRVAPTNEQIARAAAVAAEAVSAESHALHAGRASPASASVAVAMVIASDVVVAEAAVPHADRASSASRKLAAVAARSTAKTADTSRGKKAPGVASNAQAATASRGASTHAQQAARAPTAPAARRAAVSIRSRWKR